MVVQKALIMKKINQGKNYNKIAKALNHSRTPPTLNLLYSHIEDEDILKIAPQSLSVTTSLVNLNLEGNNISDIGCHQLAQGLLTNKSITNINLE
eukprot:Pgem_evm1s2468